MIELSLKYTDEHGETRRISVSDEIFVIGRHPENDLCIPDHRLSREHVRIELYADNFYVSDSGSSNGTTLNGSSLKNSTLLKKGDRLNLGGAVTIEVETEAENYDFYQPESSPNQFSPNIETPNAPNSASVAASSATGSVPTAFFWLAPVFGLTILLFLGGLFYLFSSISETTRNDENPVYTPRTRTASSEDSGDASPISPTPKKNDAPLNSNGGISAPSDSNTAPMPKVSGDVEKVEQNGSLFLRRIAQSDPRAFLTGKQAEAVSAKISRFKGSDALAENLKAVKKNAAQFETLASSKNLKAQFLAIAALAKIGSNRGDPLAVANTMLPALTELKITLDNKLADDNLMIVAAYERGAAGKPRSLQGTLEALSKTTQNVSPREIRTIWFLKNAGKITDAEYDFALQFLAIGAISQNPKDFGVNADAVTLD